MSSPAHLLPQTSNPASLPAPAPTYSHVCTTPLCATSTLITIAGQIGMTTLASGASHIPADPTAQAELALANLGAALTAAGATPRDIVRVTNYVAGYEYGDRFFREPLMRFLAGHRPPSTLLGVEKLALEGLRYEVEVMAVVSREG